VLHFWSGKNFDKLEGTCGTTCRDELDRRYHEKTVKERLNSSS